MTRKKYLLEMMLTETHSEHRDLVKYLEDIQIALDAVNKLSKKLPLANLFSFFDLQNFQNVASRAAGH